MQRRAAAAYGGLLTAITVAAAAGIILGTTPPVGYEEEATQFGPRLWAIAMLSGLSALVLLSSAYMPVRGD